MLIVDGSHLLHRCIFQSPVIAWKMYAYMVFQSLLKTIDVFKDKDVIVCWDLHQSERRKRVYPYYKEFAPLDLATPEGRKKSDELREYKQARSWLHESFPKVGFQSIQVSGIEADDIAYFIIHEKLPNLLSETDKRSNKIGRLVTEDRDWIQSITENFELYRPLSGQVITYRDFVEKYQTRERFIIRKALEGDKSDRIPKCLGIGEKTVDKYVDKIINGENIIDKYAVSHNVAEFIASGQFTTNIELIDFSLLGRGERRQLHLAFDESKQKVAKEVNFLTWIDLASEIDSSRMINFHNYLCFDQD